MWRRQSKGVHDAIPQLRLRAPRGQGGAALGGLRQPVGGWEGQAPLTPKEWLNEGLVPEQ